MRIVLLLSRIDRTGMTTNALDLAEALLELGHDVHVITGDVREQEAVALSFLKGQFLKSGVKLHFFTPRYGGKSGRQFLGNLKAFGYCIRTLQSLRPDVVHCISPYMTVVPWLMNLAYTWTVHVCNLEKHWTLKKSKRVITISTGSTKFAKQKFGYQEEEIRQVLHGVHPRFAQPSSLESQKSFCNQWKLPANKILIGGIGALEHRKGFDLLLKSVAQLPLIRKEKIHVLIIGSEKYRGEEKKLMDLVAQLHLKEFVTHIPHCNPKVAYDVMEVFVFPSRMEGFGLVVIEAMLANCCVIRSDSEGSTEQIQHGITGLLFPNAKAEALSNQLAEILKNEEKRMQLAQAGRQYAMKHFLRRRMAQDTLAVYQEVVEKNIHRRKLRFVTE